MGKKLGLVKKGRHWSGKRRLRDGGFEVRSLLGSVSILEAGSCEGRLGRKKFVPVIGEMK